MSQEGDGTLPFKALMFERTKRKDYERQAIIDDMAEALSMIASFETDDPARFAVWVLMKDRKS